MAEKKERTYNPCTMPEVHPDHLCRLMEEGRTAEIAVLASSPAYLCANCGARANHAQNLCKPQEIERS